MSIRPLALLTLLITPVGLGAAVMPSPVFAAPTAVSNLPITPSKVTSVTLYRGQALVSRTVEVPAGTGELQLVVDGLPNRVNASSLTAQAHGAGVTVRSVRYQRTAVAQAVNPEIAELDKQIETNRADHEVHRQYVWLLDDKYKVYTGQMGFVAPTAKHEMKKGVLDPKKLTIITEANLAAREAIVAAKIKRQVAMKALDKAYRLLHRKRSELTRGRQLHKREAIIYIAKTRAARTTLRLDYLVSSAGWTPTYNVRATRDGRGVNIEYLAEVQQMSGEAWDGVTVTLSTATPQMSAESPLLGPLWLGFSDSGQRPQPKKSLSFKSYASSQSRIRVQQQNLRNRPGRARAGWMMNKLAAQGQNMELNADREVVRAGRRAVKATEEALAVSYKLKGTMKLESRSDRQLVKVATLALEAEIFYEAVPLFSSYVTRYARVINTSNLPLLAGSYRAFSDGEFVGRGTVPVIARGEDFTIGLGADTQLRCYRELLDKSNDTSWGSRIQTFDYRLRIESYKHEAVQVRLYDRIPASKTKDLEIKLTKTNRTLSAEPVYKRDDRSRGILRWDLKVGKGSQGAKAMDITYRFEMKYAKDKHVGRQATGMMRAMQKDYEAMAR